MIDSNHLYSGIIHTETEKEVKLSYGFIVDVNNLYGGIMKMHNV